MKAALETLSGLECLTARSGEGDTAVVFLHGYGANMHDLFPLWELWHRKNFDWFFPNGLLSLPMGYYEGRSWFSIDMEKLERAMRMGTHRDMRGELPPEFDSTLKQLELFLYDLGQSYKRVILGGFSQGAMCASHLATRPNVSLDGIVLLSGALIAESRFPPVARGIPFYQSHGSMDPILSLEGARELEQKLRSLNFQGKLEVFEGGHEIPPTIIQGAKKFLDQFAE